jgi:hypothetical protein
MALEPSRFRRDVPSELIERLKRKPLFAEHLRDDIIQSPGGALRLKRRVFPAIRDGRFDFYHRGGKLFSFDNRGFRTNLKYAATFANAHDLSSEISEAELKKVICITDFSSGYESIKALCALYADPEAKGTSGLYGRFPFTDAGSVVVLDIESSFDARTRDSDDNCQDRIDLVLMHRDKKSLLFIEVKRFDNSAIRASGNVEPPVVTQVKRYRTQLTSQRDNILSAYSQYVRHMNQLLDLQLPEPNDIVREVPLLIFGYDGAQESGPLKKCVKVLADYGICCLTIGHLPPANVATLISWYKRAVKHASPA